MKFLLKLVLVLSLVICSFSKKVFKATNEWQTIQDGN